MRNLKILFFLIVFFVVCHNESAAQNKNVDQLRDVKTVYLDETSFNFSFSSCQKNYGNLKVVCAKHLSERLEFLIHLKRWLGKYNFVLTADQSGADAVLQGDLSIDDNANARDFEERRRNRKKDDKNNPHESPSIFSPNGLPGESVWSVRGWLINRNGEKLWESTAGNSPAISYKSGSQSKIEGKKLARNLQFGFEKSK